MFNIKLNPIASNMTLLDTPYALILFSYKTPVAIYDKGNLTYYRTDKKWSVTTSRHINKWLDGVKAQPKPQDFFDSYLGGV
jgi:hypothetical protein